MEGPTDAPHENPNVAGIVFENEPLVSENPKVKENHEERMRLARAVGPFLENHERFKGKKLSVRFAHDGVASLISIITTPEEKLALKIPFKARPTRSEALAFAAWEGVGVSVPHVIEDGTFDEGHAYLLMNYVDAPPTDKAYSPEQLQEKEIFREMGQTLRRMHRSEGKGFGPIGADGMGEFATFPEWLARKRMREDIAYVTGNGLMDEESLTLVRSILTEHVAQHPRSTYCHLDFATNNTFATKPLTVFDAAPELNVPYIDVGKTVVNMVSDGPEAVEQFIRGYEEGGGVPETPPESLDRKTLHAAVTVMMARKLRTSHETGGAKMEARIERNTKYLADNRHFLDEESESS